MVSIILMLTAAVMDVSARNVDNLRHVVAFENGGSGGANDAFSGPSM
ncbi:MAG: hypothetical protein LBF89_11035 [Bacteroidales bacterium]|nr:hypothetical protein [Bacteroidales bacterium]